jgi:HD-like signal output (HDOD) protein
MTTLHRDDLLNRVQSMDKMPTIPIALAPLLRYLEQPIENLEVQEVVELISRDKALAAQSLQIANSPLFGRWHTIDSVRGAVVALGMHRMRDIAISCSVLKLTPNGKSGLDPTVFWEHSLGCALLCRRFAHKIRFPDPGKAYLAGLLHDIGIIANLWIVPKEFERAFDLAQTQHIPLHEAELNELGITHCDSGRIVSEKWHLTSDLIQVVGFHHAPSEASSDRALVALVCLSDLLCRMCALGHGFTEERQVDFTEQPALTILMQEFPALHDFDWARLTFELEGYLDEVHRLVTSLYRPQ